MAGARDKNNKVKRPKRIGVLAGGPSSERPISLKSGEAVHNALRELGFDAVFIDVYDRIESQLNETNVDAVFITLHGGFGEDGTVQRILEGLKIPYTGSGPESSRLALDKLASRLVFQRAGIDVPNYRLLKKGEKFELGDMELPLVIKPQNEGSSVGLSVINNLSYLKQGLDKAFAYGDNVLIEEFIKGRELTVGMLNDKPLPVVEIIPEGECYDYKAKYESVNTQYLVPAPIRRMYFKKAQEIGMRAHSALGCRSFSRVDMILGNNGKIYVLEVNTIPGLTSKSLLPKAAEAAGITFCDLCKTIMEAAIE